MRKKFNKIIPLFLILLTSLILLLIVTREFIVTNEVMEDHFIQQQSIEEIQKMFDVNDKVTSVKYAFLPLIYIIKFTLISLWLLCGFFFFGYDVNFSKIYKRVIIAEFVWLIPPFITILWFGFIDTSYSLVDVKYFKPFSLLSFFGATEVQSWLIFPLQSLNLFEVAYTLVLATQVKKILNKDYKTALNFVVPVYGSALLIWIVFITFLRINFTT